MDQDQVEFNPEKLKNFKMPSAEDLLKMLDGMDLPDDEKEKIRESLLSPESPLGRSASRMALSMPQIYLGLFLALIMIMIFGMIFF